MKYKISVIIPIYNAEKHLDNTIQSIIDQSFGFENIELILVDDASKDNSRKIIQEYSKKYDNIIPYFSEKNHGYPGFGRNIGLNIATSKYIMFIDNDDKYDKDICRKLYETITNENADLAVCGRMVVDEISNLKEKIHYMNGIEKGNLTILKNDDILYFNSYIILNKIFKREIINANKMKFFEKSSFDDAMFTYEYFLYSKKLVYLNEYYGYFWNIRSDSLSHGDKKKYINEYIDCLYYQYNLLKKENKENHFGYRIKKGITGLIYECSYLTENKSELKSFLMKIHDFEKEINFNEKLNSKLYEHINQLILHNHYNTATIFLTILDNLRKIKILRKINRKISK